VQRYTSAVAPAHTARLPRDPAGVGEDLAHGMPQLMEIDGAVLFGGGIGGASTTTPTSSSSSAAVPRPPRCVQLDAPGPPGAVAKNCGESCWTQPHAERLEPCCRGAEWSARADDTPRPVVDGTGRLNPERKRRSNRCGGCGMR
jgi:hypothetical protein